MEAGLEHNLRIGELSRRVGVTPDLLRAWERRYHLLEPERTQGGLRLYSARDEERVRLMQEHLDGGYSAAQAARLALAGTPPSDNRPEPSSGALERERAALRAGLDRFDAERAQVVLDRVLDAFSLESVLSGVVLPYLSELGDRWERGDASVAQEHFASNMIRGRLMALARGWERGAGRLAVLACAPGEQHDLPLVMFGLALRGRGWRIVYLGPDTPVESIAETAERLGPDLVAVSAVTPDGMSAHADGLGRIASGHRLVIAGAGADAKLAARIGADLLTGGPVDAAASV